MVVHSESKRKGNLLLFGDFVVVETNPWFDSESGHHYLEEPAYGGFFAFGEADSPSNFVRLFAASGSPLRGQRDERAVQRLQR